MRASSGARERERDRERERERERQREGGGRGGGVERERERERERDVNHTTKGNIHEEKLVLCYTRPYFPTVTFFITTTRA